MMLAPGEFLDGGIYRLEKKIGESGMAQVWLAVEISGCRKLRILPSPHPFTPRFRERKDRANVLSGRLVEKVGGRNVLQITKKCEF